MDIEKAKTLQLKQIAEMFKIYNIALDEIANLKTESEFVNFHSMQLRRAIAIAKASLGEIESVGE